LQGPMVQCQSKWACEDNLLLSVWTFPIFLGFCWILAPSLCAAFLIP
jgi:hypothetical protein